MGRGGGEVGGTPKSLIYPYMDTRNIGPQEGGAGPSLQTARGEEMCGVGGWPSGPPLLPLAVPYF